MYRLNTDDIINSYIDFDVPGIWEFENPPSSKLINYSRQVGYNNKTLNDMLHYFQSKILKTDREWIHYILSHDYCDLVFIKHPRYNTTNLFSLNPIFLSYAMLFLQAKSIQNINTMARISHPSTACTILNKKSYSRLYSINDLNMNDLNDLVANSDIKTIVNVLMFGRDEITIPIIEEFVAPRNEDTTSESSLQHCITAVTKNQFSILFKDLVLYVLSDFLTISDVITLGIINMLWKNRIFNKQFMNQFLAIKTFYITVDTVFNWNKYLSSTWIATNAKHVKVSVPNDDLAISDFPQIDLLNTQAYEGNNFILKKMPQSLQVLHIQCMYAGERNIWPSKSGSRLSLVIISDDTIGIQKFIPSTRKILWRNCQINSEQLFNMIDDAKISVIGIESCTLTKPFFIFRYANVPVLNNAKTGKTLVILDTSFYVTLILILNHSLVYQFWISTVFIKNQFCLIDKKFIKLVHCLIQSEEEAIAKRIVIAFECNGIPNSFSASLLQKWCVQNLLNIKLNGKIKCFKMAFYRNNNCARSLIFDVKKIKNKKSLKILFKLLQIRIYDNDSATDNNQWHNLMQQFEQVFHA